MGQGTVGGGPAPLYFWKSCCKYADSRHIIGTIDILSLRINFLKFSNFRSVPLLNNYSHASMILIFNSHQMIYFNVPSTTHYLFQDE